MWRRFAIWYELTHAKTARVSLSAHPQHRRLQSRFDSSHLCHGTHAHTAPNRFWCRQVTTTVPSYRARLTFAAKQLHDFGIVGTCCLLCCVKEAHRQAPSVVLDARMPWFLSAFSLRRSRVHMLVYLVVKYVAGIHARYTQWAHGYDVRMHLDLARTLVIPAQI